MPQKLEIWCRQPFGIVLSYQLIIFEIIKSWINFDYKKKISTVCIDQQQAQVSVGEFSGAVVTKARCSIWIESFMKVKGLVICIIILINVGSWWRNQMKTFSASLALCAVNSPVTGEFPAQRPVTWSFDVFCDLRLNKRLSKQSIRRGFDTSPRSLWRHCNTTASCSSITMAWH